MTKKRTGTRKPQALALPRQLVLGIEQVRELMRAQRWTEARALVLDLDQRYPKRAELLPLILHVAVELRDPALSLDASKRLYQLHPHDSEAVLALINAYLLNGRPALGLRTLHHFLDQHPAHPAAAEMRAEAAKLEPMVGSLLAEIGVDGAEGLELAVQHEELQELLRRNVWGAAMQLGERILQRKPDFIPVLNNVSLAAFADGRVGDAILFAERVLALDAANYHAMSNLTRYLCLSARIDEARAMAERLKALRVNSTDFAVKQAEALSFLGDDSGVLAALDLVKGAEDAQDDSTPMALLYHLAAVAALRQQREGEAQAFWKLALELNPGLELAQTNLDDLKRPIGERHAPWPFTLAEWLPVSLIESLRKQVLRRSGEAAINRATQRFFDQHPQLLALVPLLLDRGDPVGREFALRLASGLKTPELLAALGEFGLSQRGPDEMRYRAAITAQQGGAIPTGEVRLWVKGQWQDLILMGFEIYGEPQAQGHSRQVLQWMEEASQALHRGDAARGEEVLRKALEREPDSPDLLNNLAAAYSMQRRGAEARALVEQIAQRYPDYLFGQTNLASILLREGKLDEAQALLDPLMARSRLHFSEFSALMNMQLELAVARKQLDSAQSWLNMWAQVEPDNPQLAVWRTRLGGGGVLSRLLNRHG